MAYSPWHQDTVGPIYIIKFAYPDGDAHVMVEIVIISYILFIFKVPLQAWGLQFHTKNNTILIISWVKDFNIRDRKNLTNPDITTNDSEVHLSCSHLLDRMDVI